MLSQVIQRTAKFATLSLIYALAATLLLAACKDEDSAEKDILALSTKTMPADSRMIRGVEIKRQSSSVRAAWEFESDLPWKDYTAWVGKSLGGDYKLINADDGAVEFRRTLPGDVHVLEIRKTAAPPLRLSAEFTALPG